MGGLGVRAVVASALLSVQLLLASAGLALGFTGFGPMHADATFGQRMTFSVELPGGAPSQLQLLLRFGGSESTLVAPVASRDGRAEYVYDTASQYVVPNTRVAYRWRAVDGETVTVSREQTLLYDDDRPALDWQQATIGEATVHWYGDSEGQARRFGEVTAGGAARAEQLLDHEMVAPVDIFVYDTRDDFFGAMGPGAREWFGAATFPQLRTIFMWLGAGSSDYLETTMVHEVTHVVFGDATVNPYHDPAKWFNEGLAVWSEKRSAADQRATVEAEARNGGLFAFDAIAYDFPFGSRGSSLSYAMGATMVGMIIETYGETAIARIAEEYRGGASDAEALSAATGVTVDHLYADYYASFGADEPQPIEPAPLPPSNVRKPGGAAGASGLPEPTVNVPGQPSDVGPWVALVAAAAVLVIVAGALLGRRRTSRGEPS
jgi:peptidase MA superfamily protein